MAIIYPLTPLHLPVVLIAILMTGRRTEVELNLRPLSFCTAEHKCRHLILIHYWIFGRQHF
jgi:hypothetical protein